MINHIKYYKDISNETTRVFSIQNQFPSLLHIIKRLLEILLEIKTTINENILEIDPHNQPRIIISNLSNTSSSH